MTRPLLIAAAGAATLAGLRCGATSGRMEWANLTGDYANTDDYQRMCVGCHRRYDAARRRATGARTSPGRRKPC